GSGSSGRASPPAGGDRGRGSGNCPAAGGAQGQQAGGFQEGQGVDGERSAGGVRHAQLPPTELGIESEKLAEFGLQPFRGRKARMPKTPQPPEATTTPLPAPAASHPEAGATLQP